MSTSKRFKQVGSIYKNLDLVEITLLHQSSFPALSKKHYFQSIGFQTFLEERWNLGGMSLYACIFDNSLKSR